MSLTALEIYLNKCRKLFIPGGSGPSSPQAVATFNRNLMSLGFVCSQDLMTALQGLNEDELSRLYQEILPVVMQMTGAHRQHQPFYPNFPKQVMEASEVELYLNALRHYWTAAVSDAIQGKPRLFGGRFMDGDSGAPAEVLRVPLRWLPEYQVEEREPLPEEEVVLRFIHLGTEADFCQIFTRLAGSNGSLSESDKAIVQWFIENRRDAIPFLLPPAIPQKENLTFLVGGLVKHEVPIYLLPYLKTATDVLRVAVVMSGSDVSLARPGKFRRFRRSERRFLLDALEAVPSLAEDMLRRPEVWKRLGRELRPGDYKKRYPKTLKAFDVVRNDEPFQTFNSKVEAGLIQEDVPTLTSLLQSRPGDFARRLDHLLRTIGRPQANQIIESFGSVVGRVSTPVLLQAHAHFLHRGETVDYRAFFPKGSVAKVQVSETPLAHLDHEFSQAVAALIRTALVARFTSLPSLGKVYLDERLRHQFVPFAQRSASKALRTITRGSRIDLPDCTTLRFFVWWKEPRGERTDIDLAAVLFNKDFQRLADVSYYNLKQWGCAHSGDITSAPEGAAEYIDADIATLTRKGVRYVQMVIYSYTQQAFKDLPECFAGWMARSKVQSGEVFEARTVQDKIDIAGDTTVNIPLLIDLVERKVIWSDIALKSRGAINNSLRNEDRLAKMGKAISNLRKPILYDLFEMHAQARGTGLVASPREAETVFSLREGITPFDADRIMSEFMTNGPNQTDTQAKVVFCTRQGDLD